MKVDSVARANWHIAVLVPARDEELLLPRCLRSISAARELLPTEVTSDIILVSDGSTDRTEELARSTLTDGAVVVSSFGRVGLARSLAAETALQRRPDSMKRCWLANTDADCEVPSGWLLRHLRAAQAGYAAVAGVVDVTDFSEHPPEVEVRFRLSYRVAADGTHPHVHGANLGVRADAYVAAGGWGTLETGEDHDLWNRLRGSGYLQLSDAHLRVTTSGRRIGRAPLGFARALAAHQNAVTA